MGGVLVYWSVLVEGKFTEVGIKRNNFEKVMERLRTINRSNIRRKTAKCLEAKSMRVIYHFYKEMV